MSGIRVASGHLFFFYAYDVGFEIALEEARALCEASDSPGIAGWSSSSSSRSKS